MTIYLNATVHFPRAFARLGLFLQRMLYYSPTPVSGLIYNMRCVVFWLWKNFILRSNGVLLKVQRGYYVSESLTENPKKDIMHLWHPNRIFRWKWFIKMIIYSIAYIHWNDEVFGFWLSIPAYYCHCQPSSNWNWYEGHLNLNLRTLGTCPLQ